MGLSHAPGVLIKDTPLEECNPCPFFLHQMFPYDPAIKNRKLLLAGLNEYRFLLNISIEAIHQYNQRNLERFDSLVGENACQIRAVRIAIMAKNNTVDLSDLEDRIRESMSAIDELIQPSKIASLMQSGISLLDLLKNEDLCIALSNDEMFLILAFILSETKEEYIGIISLLRNDVSNSRKLKKFGNISSNFVRDFEKLTRKLLSTESIKYVRELACQSDDKFLMRMTSELFTICHINCLSIPMFWTYKVLIDKLKKEGIPIVVYVQFLKKNGNEDYSVINDSYLIYESDPLKGGAYVLAENDPTERLGLLPTILFNSFIVWPPSQDLISVEDWKDVMRSFSITDLILAGAADHRQYPDSSLDHTIESLKNMEYEKFKKLAKKIGCTLNNPTTFFVHHVYGVIFQKLPFLSQNAVLSF